MSRVRLRKASSPQGSSSNGCCLFRFHHGLILARLFFPTPIIGTVQYSGHDDMCDTENFGGGFYMVANIACGWLSIEKRLSGFDQATRKSKEKIIAQQKTYEGKWGRGGNANSTWSNKLYYIWSPCPEKCEELKALYYPKAIKLSICSIL